MRVQTTSEVVPLSSAQLSDQHLTGVQFARDGTGRIISSSYDHPELGVWVRV